MKKKINIGSILSWLSLFLAVIILGTTLYQRSTGQIPMIFGWGRAVVVTGSMEPNYPVGSLILFQEQEDYGLGDVITFRDASGTLITHRILTKADTWLITKGDSNNASDEPIRYDQVVGKVKAVFPGVGQVMMNVSQPPVIIGIALFLILFLLMPTKKTKEVNNETVSEL